ncbi:MAG: hypothetical protein RMJ52_16290 [Gemmataceae bacterium]|nr:hypothetical protein [Gemmatales bacterium]MDW8266881.1 hypothetical protein [Gemmataceae bacterium]
MTRIRNLGMITLAGLLLAVERVPADEPKPIPVDQLEKLHNLIKRQPGESRWMEIDWHPTLWEARQKAAKEGKPIFIWAGSGGAPAAGC